MKNILGLFITVIGAYVFQVGFKMLSPLVQDKYSEKLVEKFAFLTQRVPDAGDSGENN